MDFNTTLPNLNRFISIWVIVDHITKIAYFMYSKMGMKNKKLVLLFFKKIGCLNRLFSSIILDWDSQIIAKECNSLMKYHNRKLRILTSFHSQTDG